MIALDTSFTQHPPESISVNLTDYGIISVSGDDASTFLQGQLTCDVQRLTEQPYLFGSLCDPTGKAFSVFWLIDAGNELLMVMHHSAIDSSLAQLQKYGVFSQVTIEDVSSEWSLRGLFGDQVTANDSDDNSVISITVGTEPLQIMQLSRATLAAEYPHPYWDALEIERVRPQLTGVNSQQFVPQMLNVQALDGISFDKGCYIGQETIARMKYLGKQKRALWRLSGQAQGIEPGTQLERKVGDNWRRAGTVISAVNRSEQLQDCLAVLPSDIELDTPIRVRGDEASLLEIHSLPYQLG